MNRRETLSSTTGGREGVVDLGTISLQKMAPRGGGRGQETKFKISKKRTRSYRMLTRARLQKRGKKADKSRSGREGGGAGLTEKGAHKSWGIRTFSGNDGLPCRNPSSRLP